MDDARLDPIYEAVQEEGLLLTMHTGFDFAFEWIDRAGPKKYRTFCKVSGFETGHDASWQLGAMG